MSSISLSKTRSVMSLDFTYELVLYPFFILKGLLPFLHVVFHFSMTFSSSEVLEHKMFPN